MGSDRSVDTDGAEARGTPASRWALLFGVIFVLLAPLAPQQPASDAPGPAVEFHAVPASVEPTLADGAR